jgi:hypothetical protein
MHVLNVGTDVALRVILLMDHVTWMGVHLSNVSNVCTYVHTYNSGKLCTMMSD